MTLRTGNRTSNRRRPRAAFTLIELILIMAILTITAAIVTPALSGFFRGRTLEAEASRMVSLTRYGQSRAVSEGIPTFLWINTRTGTYGLQQETGYADNDPKAVDYAVDKDLTLEVVNGPRLPTATAATKLPAIHFLPDGTISQTSVVGIGLQGRDGRPLWVAQAVNGLNYEIQDDNTFANRARR